MILPSLKAATTDRRLRGAPLRVLVYLHGVLEIGEYTEQQVWYIAADIGISRVQTSRAIRTLLDCGYIREGEKSESGKRRFMVLANHNNGAKP